MSNTRDTLEKILTAVKAATVALQQVGAAVEECVGDATAGDAPPNTCAGCRTLACVVRWRNIRDAPSSDKEIAEFLASHSFFKPWACPDHGAARVEVDGGVPICKHLITQTRQCRKRGSKYWPLQDAHTKIDIATMFRLWLGVANGVSLGGLAVAEGVNKNTITRQFDLLCSACLRFQNSQLPKFTKMAVDETYIGCRKYNRGARMRKRGYWFVTVTEINGDGGSGRTVWHMVKQRDSGTLNGIISQHIISNKSTVVTDEFKAYNQVNKICRHVTVNHSKGFTNNAGRHTNNAESAHGVVKGLMMKQCGRFGAGSVALRKNVALQTLKFGHPSWGARCECLLSVIRDHYVPAPLMMEEVSSDSEGEGDSETENQKKKRERDTVVSDGDDEDEEQEEDEEEDDDESEGEFFVPDNSVRDFQAEMNQAYPSTLDGQMIEGSVIFHVLKLLAPDHAVVVDPEVYKLAGARLPPLRPESTLMIPVHFLDHWIMAVVKSTDNVALVYDSLRKYNRKARGTALDRLKRVLHRTYNRWFKVVLKATVQQTDGVSCGVHCINNALAQVKVASVTRSEIRSHFRGLMGEE